MQNFNDFLGLLSELRKMIDSPNTNVSWSRFETVEDVLNTLDALQQRLELGDVKAISDLKVLFAPTGSFQEISMGSGWGEYFIKLTARFDDSIDS